MDSERWGTDDGVLSDDRIPKPPEDALRINCLGGGAVGEVGEDSKDGGDEDGDMGLAAKLPVSRFGSNISVRRLAGTGELGFVDCIATVDAG